MLNDLVACLDEHELNVCDNARTTRIELPQGTLQFCFPQTSVNAR